jgi:hypothetical protein
MVGLDDPKRPVVGVGFAAEQETAPHIIGWGYRYPIQIPPPHGKITTISAKI